MWANHPNTGGIKSYPNSSRAVNRSLDSLNSLTSTYNVTVPSSGAYSSTYDVWANSNSIEVMLWMNRRGAIGPIGSRQTTVTVGGHTWDVYRGNNGRIQVFSFLRQGNSDAGSIDIRAIMNWIRSRGWFGNVTVGNVQFGYEITSSSGGLNYTTNSYLVSYN